jgi:hypothetical protein
MSSMSNVSVYELVNDWLPSQIAWKILSYTVSDVNKKAIAEYQRGYQRWFAKNYKMPNWGGRWLERTRRGIEEDTLILKMEMTMDYDTDAPARSPDSAGMLAARIRLRRTRGRGSGRYELLQGQLINPRHRTTKQYTRSVNSTMDIFNDVKNGRWNSHIVANSKGKKHKEIIAVTLLKENNVNGMTKLFKDAQQYNNDVAKLKLNKALMSI